MDDLLTDALRDLLQNLCSGDTVRGFDESGAEVIRVPTREPLRVLPGWDDKLRVLRSNCP